MVREWGLSRNAERRSAVANAALVRAKIAIADRAHHRGIQMPSSIHSVLLASLLLSVVVPLAHAADTPSVEARLEARDLKYEIDGEGDFRLVMSLREDSRSHLVVVSARTERLDDIDIREVFAPAARIADGIDGDKALELLAESRTNKIGGWELGGDVLYYVIKMPDDIDARQLEMLIGLAATAADELEMALTGDRDDL